MLRLFRFTSSTVICALRMADGLLPTHGDPDYFGPSGFEISLRIISTLVRMRMRNLLDTRMEEGILNLERKSVETLKALCRERAINVTGRKQELIERLKAY